MSKACESYESGDYFANNPTWDEEDSKRKAGEILKLFRRNHFSPGSQSDLNFFYHQLIDLMGNATHIQKKMNANKSILRRKSEATG